MKPYHPHRQGLATFIAHAVIWGLIVYLWIVCILLFNEVLYA